MKKLTSGRSIFFLFVISGILFCRPGLSFDDGDFQYWNSESASWSLNDDWKIVLEEEFRFGDDGQDFSYQHSDLGFEYSGIADWLSLGLNYRHVFEKNSGKWLEENRPHLNAAVKWELFDCSFSNRGRFEYRNRESGQEAWRYRNKFSLKFPCKFTKFEIQPYIADEVFVDFDQGEFNRNRVYTGFALKLSNYIKAELFYLLQRSKSGGIWIDYNILGTKLKMYF